MAEKLSVKLCLNPWHCLSLGFGSGLLPKAPGTFGSIVGVGLFFLMSLVTPFVLQVAIVSFVCIAGVYLCDYTSKALGVHDHPGIVWDEIAGVMFPLLVVSAFDFLDMKGLWVIAFASFRLFDIWKPGLIRKIDKRVSGGLGIMLDDIIAGIYAAILTLFCCYPLYWMYNGLQ